MAVRPPLSMSHQIRGGCAASRTGQGAARPSPSGRGSHATTLIDKRLLCGLPNRTEVALRPSLQATGQTTLTGQMWPLGHLYRTKVTT